MENEMSLWKKVKAKINHQLHKLVNRRNLLPPLFLFLPLKDCGTIPNVAFRTILKKVPPIDFCQKSSKNDDFGKGTPY